MYKKHSWNVWSLFILFALIPFLPVNIMASDTDQIVQDWAIRIKQGVKIEQIVQRTETELVGPIAHIERTYLVSFPLARIDQAKAILVRNPNIEWFAPQYRKQRFPREISFDMVYSDPIFPYQWHLDNIGQSGGTPGMDINVRNVWQNMNIMGHGVIIGIVDNGIQHTHPDLSFNYLASDSWDFADNDSDPSPNLGNDSAHGTTIAGLAAARDNYYCGLGVAYRAGIAGIRLTSRPVSDAEVANALSFQRQSIDIYTYTWGPDDNGQLLDKPGPLTFKALAQNTAQGRNSLGNIYVVAAGNGHGNGDNVNYDGLANSRFTIAVGAVDHKGKHAAYSEPGAPLMIVAPGSGDGVFMSGTDLQGLHGESCGDCQNQIRGTSASAAQVAGVIALMIEANPDLSWRDVQHVLIHSATQNDPDDPLWTTNAAGLAFNPKYGFGMVNAEKAVKKSQNWSSVNPSSFVPYKKQVDQAIPDNDLQGISSTIDVTAHTAFKLEHVEVILNATHENRGQLQVTLTSPKGTKSILAEPHTDPSENYNSWKFMTVQNWEEDIQGQWQITVSDTQGGHTGTLVSWELVLYLNGDIGPLPPMARDDQVVTAINTPIDINIISNDFDPNGDDLTIIDMTAPPNGKVVKNADQTITYTPNDNFLGKDQFQYTVSDGRGGEDTATVSITTIIIKDPGFEKGSPNPHWIETSLHSESVIMALPNLAHSGKYLVHFKGGSSGKESATCFQDVIMPEADHASLTFWLRIMASGAYGRFSVAMDDEVLFTISQIYHAEYEQWHPIVINLDNFADGQQHRIEFRTHINSANDDTAFLIDDVSMTIGTHPPVAVDDSARTEMNHPVIIDVLTNDYDTDLDRISVSSVSAPQHGKVVINYNQTITYTPDNMFVGEDTFTYTIKDQKGESDTGNVHIIVFTDKKLILSLQSKAIEGEGRITGKLMVPEALDSDLSIQLLSSDTSEIACPLSIVTLPAGEKELPVHFMIVDDAEPDGFQDVTISATAQGWISAETAIQVADNDVGPYLKVTPESAKLPPQSGTINFSVQNKGQGNMTWTAVCNETWIRVTSSHAGTDDGIVTLEYDKNTNPAVRLTHLVILAPEAQNEQVSIKIIQEEGVAEPAILAVTPTQLAVNYQEAQAVVSVENTGAGNMVWRARANVEWLIITKGNSGVNAGQVVVQYLTNPGDAREGTIQITAPDANNSPMTVVFQQEKGYVPKPLLNVDPTFLAISEKGGALSVSVTNQGDGQMFWHADTETPWLSITDGKTGVDNGVIRIDCAENLGEERSGKIIVACAESTPPTALIRIQQQKCPPPIIAIEPTFVEVAGVAGTQEFAVTNAGGGQMSWTAKSEHSWIKIISGTTGVNDGAIIVSYDKNIDDVRLGTITVTSENAENQSVTAQIKQRKFGEIREHKLIVGDAEDVMGKAVRMTSNLIIAGASKNDERGTNAGKAYIWRFNDDKWHQEARLVASDGEQYDYFGCSVDISGNIAVIGASGNDDNRSKSGSAYIFRYNNSSWIEVAKIVASDGYLNDEFGYSIAVSGSYVLVGANGDDDLGNNSGSAYIFVYDADSEQWKEQVKLLASDGESKDNFACAVDIAGDYAIIGADFDDDHGSSSGAAYIFKRDLNTWKQLVKLTPDDGSEYDHFGYDVAISDHYAVIGAYADDVKGPKSGSAYVFENTNGTWQQVAKLMPSDGVREDHFGWSVSISGKNILVGSKFDGDNGSRSGSAYIFQRVQGQWTEMKKILSSDGNSNDYFGHSVSIHGHHAVVGAHGDDDYGSQSGSIYVYDFRDSLAQDMIQVMPQPPELVVTQLPPYGNRIQDLKGCVLGVPEKSYVINVYGKYNQWRSMCESILLPSDGCWSCDITTAPYDHLIQYFSIFVHPESYKPSEVSEEVLPEALYDNAIIFQDIQRQEVR